MSSTFSPSAQNTGTLSNFRESLSKGLNVMVSEEYSRLNPIKNALKNGKNIAIFPNSPLALGAFIVNRHIFPPSVYRRLKLKPKHLGEFIAMIKVYSPASVFPSAVISARIRQTLYSFSTLKIYAKTFRRCFDPTSAIYPSGVKVPAANTYENSFPPPSDTTEIGALPRA